MTATDRFPLFRWFRTEDHMPAPVPRPTCEPYIAASLHPTDDWDGAWNTWMPGPPELRIDDAAWDRSFQVLEVFDAWPSTTTVRTAVADDGYAHGRYAVITADSDVPAYVLIVTSMSDDPDEM